MRALAVHGQLVIIGGLMQNNSRDINSGAPVLKDLPGIGGLFRQTRQRSVKSELVILLRPMVTGPETWRKLLDDSAQRFGSYQQELKSGKPFTKRNP